MPPITNNLTDPAGEQGDDAAWKIWEQTFRDARPVLPEAAMARIEASIRRESERAAVQPSSRLRQWILLLFCAMVAVNVTAAWLLMRTRTHDSSAPGAAHAALLQDHIPLAVTIGQPLVAPDRPLTPIAEYAELLDDHVKRSAVSASSFFSPELIKAADHLITDSLDGWRALGIMEIHRAAGQSAPRMAPLPPHADDYYIAADWRLLPLNENAMPEFKAHLAHIDTARANVDVQFWAHWYAELLAQRQSEKRPASLIASHVAAAEFPSRLADRARFDLLTYLGETRAQAALDVLSTRSYAALEALRADGRRAAQAGVKPNDFRPISHDLVERLFSLRLLGMNDEAERLAKKASQIRYLNDPQELALLLARLGTIDAWEKLLRPLMEDEVDFILNPPTFEQSRPQANQDAIIEAGAKSVQEGVTTYDGPSVKVTVGPWRITCGKLTAFHNLNRGILLSGAGNATLAGVIGLYDATADEISLDTETGQLKLTGHVHLNGWDKSVTASSATIMRTGELREVIR